MANEVRILASITVDLSTADPQPIDMSAYARYAVLGYAYDHLALAIPSGSTSVAVKNSANLSLASLSLYSNAPIDGGFAVVPGSNQPVPIQPGGDLHVTVAGTLRAGNSVIVHVVGLEVS